MKRVVIFCILIFPYLIIGQKLVKPEPLEPEPVTDTYHGISIEDPYRNLEDLKDEKVLNWMKENTRYAQKVLKAIPERDEMIKKIEELDSRTTARITNLRITDNDNYYFLKTRPEDELGKLYFRKTYHGEDKLLLDPGKYSKGKGQTYAISNVSPSDNGELVAILLAPNGSENGELVILDKEGNQIDKTIELADFMAWSKDDKAVYYLKLNSPDIFDMERQLNLKVYKHTIGTDLSEDKVVFSSEKYPELKILPEEIPILVYDKFWDTKFGLVLTVDRAIKLYLKQKVDGEAWTQLTKPEDNVTYFRNDKKNIYYRSYKDAPNFKITVSSINNPEFGNSRVFIEEPEEGPISGFHITKDGLYYTVKENGVKEKLYFKGFDKTKSKEIKLPYTASNVSLSSKGPEFSDLWVTLSGWTTPERRYKYEPETGKFVKQALTTEAEYPELENLIVKEVLVSSHDGVKVPVSIIHNKDIEMDGSNQTTMYGYGSYGISTGPFFSPVMLVHTMYDGIFVVPHVRGGGELGDAWHRAGQKQNKPNTWKDAIAAAEYLINEGYTSPEKLSFFGGSAGGILVGRAVTERPDLFSAVAPMVGAMNTLRMEETPNGPVNAPEFGTVKDPIEFKALLEMDSYHHLEEGVDYPAMLITSGINDPRVIAWEPAKFAARAQALNSSDDPILLLTDFESGHGRGDTKSKRFERYANVFSFFHWQAGHPKFQPAQNIVD